MKTKLEVGKVSFSQALQQDRHPSFKCWRRSNAKCNKCNELGHEVVICRKKIQQQEVVKSANEKEEDQLFIVTCFSRNV